MLYLSRFSLSCSSDQPRNKHCLTADQEYTRRIRYVEVAPSLARAPRIQDSSRWPNLSSIIGIGFSESCLNAAVSWSLLRGACGAGRFVVAYKL